MYININKRLLLVPNVYCDKQLKENSGLTDILTFGDSTFTGSSATGNKFGRQKTPAASIGVQSC